MVLLPSDFHSYSSYLDYKYSTYPYRSPYYYSRYYDAPYYSRYYDYPYYSRYYDYAPRYIAPEPVKEVVVERPLTTYTTYSTVYDYPSYYRPYYSSYYDYPYYSRYASPYYRSSYYPYYRYWWASSGIQLNQMWIWLLRSQQLVNLKVKLVCRYIFRLMPYKQVYSSKFILYHYKFIIYAKDQSKLNSSLFKILTFHFIKIHLSSLHFTFRNTSIYFIGKFIFGQF